MSVLRLVIILPLGLRTCALAEFFEASLQAISRRFLGLSGLKTELQFVVVVNDLV